MTRPVAVVTERSDVLAVLVTHPLIGEMVHLEPGLQS
jgi:hypothetical protein